MQLILFPLFQFQLRALHIEKEVAQKLPTPEKTLKFIGFI